MLGGAVGIRHAFLRPAVSFSVRYFSAGRLLSAERGGVYRTFRPFIFDGLRLPRSSRRHYRRMRFRYLGLLVFCYGYFATEPITHLPTRVVLKSGLLGRVFMSWEAPQRALRADLPLFETSVRSERFSVFSLLPNAYFKRFVRIAQSESCAFRQAAVGAQFGIGYLAYEDLAEYFQVPFDLPLLYKGSRILREPVSIPELRAVRRIFRLGVRGGWSWSYVGAFRFSEDINTMSEWPVLNYFDRLRVLGLENISHVGMSRR